jgi:uncharacterized protein HemX
VSFRIGSLLAGALASGVLLLALPVAALAAPCVIPICTPTASPSPSLTASRTPDPTPTHTSDPGPTATRTSSPRPHTTTTRSVAPTPSATTTDVAVTTTGPTATSSPVAVQPDQVSSEKSGGTTKLVALILGAAILLGVGGVSGLYLTRTPE